MEYSIKDLDFLWSKTVNLRKRNSGEHLMIKGIVSAMREKYGKSAMKCIIVPAPHIASFRGLTYHCQKHKSLPSGCSRVYNQATLSELPSSTAPGQAKHSGEILVP